VIFGVLMIYRAVTENIMLHFNKGKVICIMGPRQTGKTTLARFIAESSKQPYLWINGDESDAGEYLSNTTSAKLRTLIGNNKLVIIDEAQRIQNIGITLKLFADNFSDIQVIATGSSSFELANTVNEPLTGRKIEYTLFPFSYREISDHFGIIDERRLLEHRMIYGYYPEVVNSPGNEKEILRQLSESYLYRDLFSFGKIKKPPLLEKILKALALQLGSEVSYNEIGQLTGSDPETVEKYIDLLEKAFVVFRLSSLSRNLGNEIKKGRKIYFYDNGIRNSIIKNFNPLNLRTDTGAILENFLLAERMKANQYKGRWVNAYFWRTHAQQEINYIEEYSGKLHAYEFKWKTGRKPRFPKSFIQAYPESETSMISAGSFESYEDFILR